MTAEKKTTVKASEAKSVTDAAVEQLEAAVTAQSENLEKVVKVGTETATKNYEKAVAMTKEQVEGAVKASNDMFKGYEDMVAFGKSNVDAVIKSTTILSKGLQDINSLWFALAQESLEDSVAQTKAILGCKNLKEVVEVQSDFSRSGYEKIAAESRRLSEMSAKVAEESVAPLSAQMNAAVEKFTKPLAA